MPITQERMLSLVSAAEAWQRFGLGVRDQIRHAIREYDSANIDWETFTSIIRDISHSGLLPDHEHSICISTEKRHFALRKRSNERSKVKMTNKRKDLQLLIASYDPDSILHAIRRPRQSIETPKIKSLRKDKSTVFAQEHFTEMPGDKERISTDQAWEGAMPEPLDIDEPEEQENQP
jgi:hypothetical protein